MILYYIVNAADVPTFLPYMEAALGHSNVEARYSIDDPVTKAIMEFDDGNLPPGYTDPGYDKDQIKDITKSSTLWTELPEPITGVDRVVLDTEYGVEVRNVCIDIVRQHYLDGDINENTYRSWSATNTDFHELLVVLGQGNLEHSSYLLAAMSSKSYFTQADIDACKADIDARVAVLDGLALS